MDNTLSEQLADFVTDLTFGDLPAPVVGQAKRATLDQLGCQLIGSILEWNQIPYCFIRDLDGKPESTIINYGTKALVHDAAYVNGTFGQGAELDDYLDQGYGHNGALCVPVALAFSESKRTSGRDFLTAIVIGYQVSWAIGRLMYPGFNTRGFHPQSVIGVFAAAAVAGRLLGLTRGQMAHAFGIAGSHAGGTMEFDQSGGEVKRIHTGIAVRGGIQSAMLAGRGLTGPRRILEGERGICTLFAGQCSRDKFNLEGEWGISHNVIKLHPCVATIQSSIDLLGELITRHSIHPRQVTRIEVGLSELALKHGATIVEPRDVVGAQFSLAYSLAVRLVKSDNELPRYMDCHLWRDPEILRLAHNVEAHVDPEMKGERSFASRIKITLDGGGSVQGFLAHSKGTPSDPVSDEELQDKFRKLAAQALPIPRAGEIIRHVQELDQLADASAIVPLLVR